MYFSSAQVFGLYGGDHRPEYLPLDDDHPRLAARPYGRSKCVAEDLCAAFSARTGLASISLRPFMVLDEARYGMLAARWAENPDAEWTDWELGAFVDVRDVTPADVARALTAEWFGSVAVSLCADRMAATKPAAAVVPHLLPGVEWPAARSLSEHGDYTVVDTSRATGRTGLAPTTRVAPERPESRQRGPRSPERPESGAKKADRGIPDPPERPRVRSEESGSGYPRSA